MSDQHLNTPPADLPEGFEAAADGIYILSETSEEEPQREKLCSLISLKGLFRDAQSKNWGKLFEICDPDGNVHEVQLESASLSSGPNLALKPLLERGFSVAPGRGNQAKVLQLIQAWTSNARFNRLDALGWCHDRYDCFVTTAGTVIGPAPAIVRPGLADPAGPASNGDIHAWRDNVASLCTGNPLAVLSVCHALSGPLLRILGKPGGGFHLYGHSSRGKSTLQEVATSVWAHPSKICRWRSTANGLELSAKRHNDQFLALDEIAEIDARELFEVIYMLGNGQGKMRMNRNGGAEERATWLVPVLSSGEISVADHLASAGKQRMSGQEVRMIDISVNDLPDGAFPTLHGRQDQKSLAEEMSAASNRFHSSAGPALVRALITNTRASDLQELLKKVSHHFLYRLNVAPDPATQRAIDRFAIAVVAGTLATNHGITGWSNGEVLRSCASIAEIWLTSRGTPDRDAIKRSLAPTLAYLEMHGTERLKPVGPEVSQDGWFDDECIYLKPGAWQRIHSLHEARQAASAHDAAGVLKVSEKGTLQHRMPRQVPGRPRAYAVRINELRRAMSNDNNAS